MEEWEKHNEKIPTCIAAANKIINRTNAYNMWLATQKTGESNKPLARVKLYGTRLQKILYLCQLFWYADHDESKMITEDFQAWPNGPTIPVLYDYFMVYQDGDMCPIRDAGIYSLTQEEEELINKVVDNTIDISTETMIDYTHSPDGPWAPVYKNYQGAYDIISKENIKKYIRNKQHQEELIAFVKTKKLSRHE